jgi:hypothetical protein
MLEKTSASCTECVGNSDLWQERGGIEGEEAVGHSCRNKISDSLHIQYKKQYNTKDS